MAAMLDVVLGCIKANEFSTLGKLGPDMAALFGRRNLGLIWPALIDQAAKNFDMRKPIDCLGSIKALAARGLPLDQKLDSGDHPLNMLLERSPRLAAAAIRELPFDVNNLGRGDGTPSEKCLKIAGRNPLDYLEALEELVASSTWSAQANDQGAKICFAIGGLFPYMSIHGGPAAAAGPLEKILDGLVRKGCDLNAARLAPVAKTGSPVNTPLAFCVKKAARWAENGGKGAAREAIHAVARMFIERGADPSLQMEPGDRVALMDVCRQSSLGQELAATLESGVLRAAVGGAGSGKAVRSRL